jgi:NitT/TauT family transport system substrate-binding protein
MAAQLLVDRKLRKADDQEFMAQALREIPYDKWRDYSPEDTIRFWALRLNELGIIKPCFFLEERDGDDLVK